MRATSFCFRPQAVAQLNKRSIDAEPFDAMKIFTTLFHII